MARDHRKIRSGSYERGSMRDCNLAAGQNSQAANCCLPCSRGSFFFSFFFCSTKLLATFPSSARSGSPTPHLSADPFQILSRAVMRAEAPVKQKEVWLRRAGRTCRQLRRENEVWKPRAKRVGSVDNARLLGVIRRAGPASGKMAT